MERIPPSQKVRQRIYDLLHEGIDEADESGITTRVIRLGVERLIQEMLEEEVKDYLGRDHYQRRDPDEEHRGYRNGYEPGRVRTGEGEVVVQVPQVREAPETYRSSLMARLRGKSETLERLATEMYVRGLSTRDIEDAIFEATGERLLSRSAVSRLTETIWQDYQGFIQRNLSHFPVVYLFLDAVFESLRQQGGGKEGILCAWAICADGRKVLLHMALGNKESYQNWLDFLRDMVGRGICVPVLITTDGAPGLIRAVKEVFPLSLRQRCLAHKTRNITDKIPERAREAVKAAVQGAYYAPNQQIAEMIATDVLKTYQDDYPSAMASFRDDWEACIAYLRCPTIHHKRIRTTNLLERSFLEERRRTRTIPRFFTEKSCLKLVFATLWQASCRWQGVRMSEFELQQIASLRKELRLGQSKHADQRAHVA
jgi:transposase-like protein